MRELHLNLGESTATSLVFDDAEHPEKQYFLAVSEDLRNILCPPEQHSTPAKSEAAHSDSSTPEADTETVAPRQQNEQDEQDEQDKLQPSPAPAAPVNSRPQREVDPRLSTPLKDSPRQIQERIRSGASIAEVAESNGVTESRIEPYAHPILLERARMAEMAKQAHPARDDGPARLSLWEVLATAFAARGLDLAGSTWDAYRETGGQWVVAVYWDLGGVQQVAEWSYHAQNTSTPTAVARNGLAAELLDPQAPLTQTQPATLELGRSRFNQESGLARVASESRGEDLEDTRDDLPPITELPRRKSESQQQELEGEELLQNPGQKSTRKRRKAITPHWEDVLLGVRANTQRPKDGK